MLPAATSAKHPSNLLLLGLPSSTTDDAIRVVLLFDNPVSHHQEMDEESRCRTVSN